MSEIYTAVIDGKTVNLQLIQDPYISSSGLTYEAAAIDADDIDADANYPTHMLFWDVIDLDCDDEANSCDWDEFTTQEL